MKEDREREREREKEREKEARIAATASAASSSSSSASSLSTSSIEVPSFPAWVDVLWAHVRELLTSADALLEEGRAASAVVALTHALHVHAALPSDHPRSVLHNLYGYRSVAYLRLDAPLPHLAVWDAITALKCHRDYLHAFGLMFNAWRAFGNERKAWEAADLGEKNARSKGEADLAQRFADMRSGIERQASEREAKHGAVDAAEKATEAIVVEARNVRPALQLSRRDHDMAQFQDAVQRSLTSHTLYCLPHITVLPPPLALLFPTSQSPDDFARDLPLYAAAAQGKGIETALTASLGRHVVASRAFRAGEVVLSEKPLYAGTVCDDVCAACWRPLSKVDGRVVDELTCSRLCGYELYCSTRCRDERAALHEPICGHDWRELRERVAASVTTSALCWLLLPLVLGDVMREVKKRERNIRAAAIAESLGDNAASKQSPLTAPWDAFSALPFSRLLAHYELPQPYVAHAQHNFDTVWAMATLLSHWFVVTPPSSARSVRPPPEPSLASAASLSFLPHLSYDVYERALSRLLLNSFAFHAGAGTSAQPRRLACVAVGLLSSLFTHSCFPNCRLQDDAGAAAGRIVMVAQRAIRKGEVLTVSYVDASLSKVDRAEALLQYGFACACARCRREKGHEKELAELFQSMHIAQSQYAAQ